MSTQGPQTPGTNARLYYVNGLQLSWLSTTTIGVAIGGCSDSYDINDIELTAPVVINILQTGANGCDTAPAVASTMYAVWAIGDSHDFKPTAALLSLAINAQGVVTQPTLPFGYDMYRRIGYVLTDSSAHVLKFWQYANNVVRTMYYDVQIAAPTTTAATTYANISLATSVPPITTQAIMRVEFTPNTASDIATFVPYGSTSTGGVVNFGYGSATTVPQQGMMTLPLQLNATNPLIPLPSFSFKTTSASDTLVMLTAGYIDNL